MNTVLLGIIKILIPPILLFTAVSQTNPDNYFFGSQNIAVQNYISPTPTFLPTFTPSPTMTLKVTINPVSTADLDNWFEKYANQYSIDRSKLIKIAVCESNLKSNAINGLYGGLFQFSPSAWKSTRILMNSNPDPDLRFNPEEAIKTAAFKISVSGSQAWPSCEK